ncbi:MAG TPA: SAVED domain-containing protein, partial [Chloroflexota bacterium]|nr:SAVED domain-containing protein [Chloroflexota bacterium]
MSQTAIPAKVSVLVWMRCGGRCAFPGCNIPLWQDGLTLRQMNAAHIAHIVADRAGGPRGDRVLSRQLAKDPENLMLLCPVHSKLVDVDAPDDFPVERLRQIRRDHEQRIELQTSVHTDRRTHVILFGAKIADRQGEVNYAQACQALIGERYPADHAGFRIELRQSPLAPGDAGYWEATAKYVAERCQQYLDGGQGLDGSPLAHLSLFALAPIPLLIAFGKAVGDIISADVYERHRAPQDWRWRMATEPDFDYQVIAPPNATGDRVALKLSLSDVVPDSGITAFLTPETPTYTITVNSPRRGFLEAKEQLERFKFHWSGLLTDIRAKHGEDCQVHVFAAVPASIAVEIGRSLLPKSDARLFLYDYDREHGKF